MRARRPYLPQARHSVRSPSLSFLLSSTSNAKAPDAWPPQSPAGRAADITPTGTPTHAGGLDAAEPPACPQLDLHPLAFLLVALLRGGHHTQRYNHAPHTTHDLCTRALGCPVRPLALLLLCTPRRCAAACTRLTLSGAPSTLNARAVPLSDELLGAPAPGMGHCTGPLSCQGAACDWPER